MEIADKSLCALCKLPRILRNSHIYPKHVFKQNNLLNPKKSKYEITKGPKDEKDIIVNLEINPYDKWKGYTEKNLLCESCEKLLSKYEDYISKNLFDKVKEIDFKKNSYNWNNKELPEYLLLEKCDYKKAKLYFLSILWRCSVAKGNFFKALVLESKLNEKLRQALFSETIVEDEFPFILITPKEVSEGLNEIIIPFRFYLIANKIYYLTVFGRYMLLITHKIERIEGPIEKVFNALQVYKGLRIALIDHKAWCKMIFEAFEVGNIFEKNLDAFKN